MFEQKIEQYIRLIIELGAAVVPGDYVHISSDVKTHDFTERVVKAAYDAGAKEVTVDWTNEVVGRYKGLYAADEVFDIYPTYEAAKLNDRVEKRSKRLSIVSPDPEGMAGVDSSRLMRAQIAAQEPMRNYREKMMGDFMNWSIAAVPCVAWAKKVFPNAKSDEDAMELLWEAIFDAVHLNDGPDSVENWSKHTATIHAMVEKLNALELDTLHYTGTNGTDFVVGLPKGHKWAGGGATNVETGQFFSPNMPTEEAYTLPDCNRADGIIHSTKPLLYNGQLIEDFYFEFKDGAVVKAHAEKGNEMLQEMLKADAGASRLGEVALVPYASPISLSDNLFYMTLFDENASCHFALGAAYETTLPASAGLPEAEANAMGRNTSLIHVDFMVGDKNTNIMGTTVDGQSIAIFKDGNFAI